MSKPNGFDFTAKMRQLCNDLTSRLPELAHIDLSRVAFSLVQVRNRSIYGTHATLTPLRFESGSLTTIRRGRSYTVQRLYDESGEEMLYVLSFYLPRFMNVDHLEKLSTVVHELWHISPEFDGDIRRHPGRCYAHSHSAKEYDALMEKMALKWLSLGPPDEVHRFLRLDFAQLNERFGPVYGTRIRQPKLIPLPESA